MLSLQTDFGVEVFVLPFFTEIFLKHAASTSL